MCVSFCAIKGSLGAASRSRGDWVFFWVQPCCNFLDLWCKTMVFWNTEKNWKRSHRIEISNCFLRVAPPIHEQASGPIEISEARWRLHLPVHLCYSRSDQLPFAVTHPSHRSRIIHPRFAHPQLCQRAYLLWYPQS